LNPRPAVYKTAALPLSYASGSAPVRGTGPASGLFPMRDSTSSRFAHKTEKPAKPYPEFPLLAHAAGVWTKKIRGKLHYFGKWDDPDSALKKYLAEKDDLHAGKKPRASAEGGVTVKDLCSAFLNAKQARVDTGELSPHTFGDYKEAAALLVERFGKGRVASDLRADDFAGLRTAMTKRWGWYG
jgi:hypothetical protein